MLVFYKERLVLLAMPKTGSTAYQSALRDRADLVISGPPELKHAPVFRYSRWFRPMFARVCDTRMELVAVMREPISWLGSWYRYRQRDAVAGLPVSTAGLSFDDFVRGYVKGNQPAFANVGSQAKFLEAQPNGTGISHLFRYEDLSRLDRFLEDRLEIELRTPRLNCSPRMDLTLSPAMEQRLRRKCAAEFALYDSI